MEVMCIAVVDFNDDLGPEVVSVHPPDSLSDNLQHAISYLALPDSLQLESSCLYHFKINSGAADNDIFGYVSFRREPSSSKARGVSQKSLVLLTKSSHHHHHYHALYRHAMRIIARPYFAEGRHGVIQRAYADMEQWSLDANELHLLDSKLTIGSIEDPVLQIPGQLEEMRLSGLDCVNLSACVQFIKEIHLLWEIVLVGEMVFVLSDSPNKCSELIQALTALIRPIQYRYEYVPYSTIHDSQLLALIENVGVVRNSRLRLVGATNPHFKRTCQNWPNIIDLCASRDPGSGSTKLHGGGRTHQSVNGVTYAHHDHHNHNNNSNNNNNTNNKGRYRKGTEKSMKSHYKNCFKDTATCWLQRQLERISSNGVNIEELNESILRKYVHELTMSFLRPLEQYLSALLPGPDSFKPLVDRVPAMKAFSVQGFIAHVKQGSVKQPPPISMVAFPAHRMLKLYRRFCHSENFKYWLNDRIQSIDKSLQRAQLKLMSSCDINTLLAGKDEIEILDAFLVFERMQKRVPLAAGDDLNSNAIELDRYYDQPLGPAIDKQLERIIHMLPVDHPLRTKGTAD